LKALSTPGGAPKVEAVVGELIDRMSSDPKLKRSFDRVDLVRVKNLFAEQICSLTGGGCSYTGDSMRDVHGGLEIDQAEFYATVELLRDVMRSHGIGLSERNELLEILAPMKRDVVER
jgi:hemoglobin